MRQINGRKRAAQARVAEAAEDNENVQPALVNSAVANAGDPLPEGNWKEVLDKVQSQARSLATDQPADVRRAFSQFAAEFERRARVMPFIRFVKNGSAMPVEIGNVDKLQAPDGSGTYYMFPTSENLRMAFAGDPEDPTQGQEAQGGPLHGITGRGEKYAGGNVETSILPKDAQDSAWEGKGSQTGDTGVQRASLGDRAALNSAVEDYGDGTLRPLAPGTIIEQVGKTHENEPGVIRRTTDVSKLTGKGDMFRVAKDKEQPRTPKANIASGQEHLDVGDGPGAKGKPTVVDTRFADAMKEGQKTATDAAAAGAVTAGNSASDIEKDSPGIVGGFDGKQSEDASEGTRLDTLQPTVEPMELVDVSEGVYEAQDWNGKTDEEIIDFLNDHNVPIQTGAQRTDLEALAAGVKTTKAGDGLARQKSDEATPQLAGGVLAGGDNAQVKPGETKAEADDTPKPAKTARPKARAKRKTASKAKKAATQKAKTPAKKGGVTIQTGSGTAKPSTTKAATGEASVSTEEAKKTEPGVVKGEADENKS
jgi:hypothetical protein